ncbi:MAG: LD-carboxypeptidase [Alphaproteobacteria bacterium]|nr:LD-carboxypeptidase [Alphaproteobacteria bacterium]MBQ8630695.1 LD-carboxypeptidase [Alphaproteobacteria bacterium]
MVPQVLKAGDEVRIVAPARGLRLIGRDSREIAKARFEEMGLKVTFGRNTTDENWDMFGSTDVEKRAEDLNEAFGDKNVKAVFTVIGGSNSNQLLPYLDYELIRQNPKIFCGFSDITALLNGIYAKTGLVTFSGPHFSSLGMKKGAEYTLENLKKMILGDQENEIKPSDAWSDDLWFINQEDRTFIKNEGWQVINAGKAEGTIVGGNLGTFDLLLGSSYRPAFEKNTVLFVEECFTSEATDAGSFERNLQALIYQPDFENVSGIVIGRFQKASNVTKEKLEYIIKSKKALDRMPVIANVDFGHTTPLLTLPIGGECSLDAESGLLTVKA